MKTIRPRAFATLLPFLLATSMHGGQVLSVELIAPARQPLVIEQAQFDALAAVVTAEQEKRALMKSIQEGRISLEEREKLRDLEAVIEKGRKAKQGIELKLRLTNTGKKPLSILYGPDTSKNILKLEGPGALNLPFTGMMTMDFRQPKPLTIEAGAARDFPIKELRYGSRDMSRWLITAPGRYTVTVRFATRIDGQKIDLASEEITFEVRTR